MNLVEVFFSIVEQQAMRRGVFKSVKDINAKIRAFLDGWNDSSHPFVSTKTADEILKKANRPTTSSPRRQANAVSTRWWAAASTIRFCEAFPEHDCEVADRENGVMLDANYEAKPWDPALEIAKWAHTWAAAATEIYVSIERLSMPEEPATEIGRRDSLTMALVDTVRNVMRGAEEALGRDAALVEEFKAKHPMLINLRNLFEHYEEYLQGTGTMQRAGHKRMGEPLALGAPGIRITMSSGGTGLGHDVTLEVTERDKAAGAEILVTYSATTRELTIAARTLARDLLAAVSWQSDKHLDTCGICSDPDRP